MATGTEYGSLALFPEGSQRAEGQLLLELESPAPPRRGLRSVSAAALMLLTSAAAIAMSQRLGTTSAYAAENNLVEGKWNGWTDWTKLGAEGDLLADIYLPPGAESGACPGGVVAIIIKQGYDKDYTTINYFHDWMQFGVSCAANPMEVIWQDEKQDNICCQKKLYKYKATDFNADEYLNITCNDNPGDGNKKFIRGFEVRRYETKGIELGAKGRNAMQIRDQINVRPICDFLHNLDPDQFGAWKGIPYGTMKETQGLYCLARRGHRGTLNEPNVQQLNVRIYNKMADNKQTVQFRAKCGMPQRAARVSLGLS